MQRHVRHCFTSLFRLEAEISCTAFRKNLLVKTGSPVDDSSGNFIEVFVSGTAAVPVYNCLVVYMQPVGRVEPSEVQVQPRPR